MLSKHEECLQQKSQGKCRQVNAPDPEDISIGPSKVPRGNASVTDWGLPVISVLGTVFIVGTCCFGLMLLKRRKSAVWKKGGKQLKHKKGTGKSGKKGQQAPPPPLRRFPKFTATVIPANLSGSQNEAGDFTFVLETLSGSPGSQASSALKASNSPPAAEIHPADDDSEFDTQSDCSSSSCDGWSD